MEIKNQFAKKLMDIQAIKLQPNDPFTWASGWKSPIYTDNRKTLSFPELRSFVKLELCHLIQENFPEAEAVAGVATGAIAQGALVADQLGLPYSYVRPKPKDHGMGNQVEGEIKKGAKVVVVEDLISTGGSSLKAVAALREYGVEVIGMVASFTYGFPVAEEAFKEAGVKVGIQTVASSYNCGYVDALSVFSWACANNVDNWSILRFFASGRGAAFPEAALNDAQCEQYVHMVQEIAANPRIGHKPAVDFHYLMPGHKKHTDVCRCVRHSIGILPNGNVVACFWALDSNTGTVEDKYLLGNVRQNSLLEILNGEKAHYWSDCEHCCDKAAGCGLLFFFRLCFLRLCRRMLLLRLLILL